MRTGVASIIAEQQKTEGHDVEVFAFIKSFTDNSGKKIQLLFPYISMEIL